MAESRGEPRALFLSPDGRLYPDELICSGVIPSQLQGMACPFSDAGRMPRPRAVGPGASPRSGLAVGETAPPCALEGLGSLADWEREGAGKFPEEILSLRVFKCRQMFLLVVPGIQARGGSSSGRASG